MEIEKFRRQIYECQRCSVNFQPIADEEKAKWARAPKVKTIIKSWIDEQNAPARPGTKVVGTLLNRFGVPQ